MRHAVRAIVLHDDKLLVMRRNKFGHEYYTLIGGKIDMGEAPEAALLREVTEETSIVIDDLQLVFVEEAGDPYGTQYVYKADYVSGEPTLDPKSIEASIHAMGQNLYEPMWLPIAELAKVPFLSEGLKQAILEGLQTSFQGEPKTIHTSTKIGYNS
jgi:8-oxo-dGTP pyrophosphatase MutT (NUDIX family)